MLFDTLSKTFIVDIETKPNPKLEHVFERFHIPSADNIQAPGNYKDPAKIAEYIANKRNEIERERESLMWGMAVKDNYADVRMVAVKPIGEDPYTVSLADFASWLLEEIPVVTEGRSHNLPDTPRYKQISLVTFNGKNFDLPVMVKASIREKIAFPISWAFELTQKYYKGKQHVDLAEVVRFDWKSYSKLDEYLQIFLGIEKTPIDFQTCTDEELRAHAIEDVVNTEKLFLLFKEAFNQ
jgi:hypothetical protein